MLINIEDILNNSPSVAILKARSCNVIIDFLTNVFNDANAISHENIHSLLAEYLNNHGVDEDEESEVWCTQHHFKTISDNGCIYDVAKNYKSLYDIETK